MFRFQKLLSSIFRLVRKVEYHGITIFSKKQAFYILRGTTRDFALLEIEDNLRARTKPSFTAARNNN